MRNIRSYTLTFSVVVDFSTNSSLVWKFGVEYPAGAFSKIYF